MTEAKLHGEAALAEIAMRYGIKARFELLADSAWQARLLIGRRRMTFLMPGFAVSSGEPSLMDALVYCSKAASGIAFKSRTTFRKWCSVMEVDRRDPLAMSEYRWCKRIDHKLRRFLLDADYALFRVQGYQLHATAATEAARAEREDAPDWV